MNGKNSATNIEDRTRRCSTCKNVKPFEDFGKASKEFCGIGSYCLACISARNASRADYLRDYQLKRLYGIDGSEYESLWSDQEGLCKVCLKPETHSIRGIMRKLSVDHCHSTGRVRGLLCHKCNNALGLINDDPDTLRSALSYLRKFSQ